MNDDITNGTKQCPFCSATIKAQATKCRFCNRWLNENSEEKTFETPTQSKTNVTKVQLPQELWGAIAIFIIFFGISHFNFFFDNFGTASNLEVTESHICSLGYGLTAVCGTVINKSSRNVNHVNIEINLYDRNGNVVGNTLDGVDNLEGKASWTFQAPITQFNVDSYKITNITCF